MKRSFLLTILSFTVAGSVFVGCQPQTESPITPSIEDSQTAEEVEPEHDHADSGEDAALQLARRLIEEAGLFSGEIPVEDQGLVDGLAEDIQAVNFADDPTGNLPAETLFAENPLLSENNPLVTKNSRERWLASAIRNVGTDMALAHLEEETSKLERGEVTRSEWYDHVAKCEKFCNRVITGLLYEHIQKVQTLPHQLVLFDSNSDLLGSENRVKLEALTRGREGSEILLIGRASRSGNLEFNRKLSERRVDSTKKALQELGFGPQQIHGFWLGYEPPQITPELAVRYGFDPELSTERINQSVLAVAYTLEESVL